MSPSSLSPSELVARPLADVTSPESPAVSYVSPSLPSELLLSPRPGCRPPGSSYKRIGKGKAEHLYSSLHGIQTNLKRSGKDHTVLPAINNMAAFTS